MVSESTVSWAAGARAVLRCQSPRMVWTQDRLHDRQRVVHWDLSGSKAGGPARRLVDMYSTGEQRVGEQRLGEQRVGEQRVYEPRDRGRLLLPPSAFHDGNFSLFIRGTSRGTAARGRGLRGAGGAAELTAGFPPPIPWYVAVEETDEGLYTCKLHHHYCHLYESLAVSLEVTDDRECAPPTPRPCAPTPATLDAPSRLPPGPGSLTTMLPQPGPPARTGTARKRCWLWSAARLRC